MSAVTETKPALSMNVCCMSCGMMGGIRSVYLDNPTTIYCHECNSEFSVDDLRENTERAMRLLAWLDLAPRQE